MYTILQKASSAVSHNSLQKKSENLVSPRNFSVQTKPDTQSLQKQEMPSYSRAAADSLYSNVMRSMEGGGHLHDIGIQRKCSECAKEDKDSDEISSAVGVQTKLTVGALGDRYEPVADRVAAQVMRMSIPPNNSPQVQRFGEKDNSVQRWWLAHSITPVVQRRVDEQVQMRQLVQRAFQAGGNQASGDLESRLNASKGRGSALAPEVRAFMEPRFGADFSSVRVHTGSEAVQMNRELGAQAFTHGSDVYFGAGKSPGNNELTAHELTHVVQQTGSGSSIQRLPIVISSVSQCIQKDEEAERVRKLNEDYENAVAAKDWQKAAELLNAFNREDILTRLSKLKRGQIGAIHQGALDNRGVGSDSQVAQLTRAAYLDLNYENERKAGRWEQAAVFLNGFNDTDIRIRLQKLNHEELKLLFTNCPKWATRVTGAIAALDQKAADSGTLADTVFEIEPDDPAHPGQINLSIYNPRNDPLYVDRRVTAVGYGIYLGGYYLYCEGLSQPVFVPQSYVNFGLTNAVSISDSVCSDYAAANNALQASPSKIGLPQYAYYRGAGGALIAPTVFSPATTPRTIQTMLTAMKELADEVQKELVVLGLTIVGSMAIKAVISRIARVGQKAPEPAQSQPNIRAVMTDAEAFTEARNVRNQMVNDYHGMPKAQREQIATVTGGVNVETGKAAAGYNTAGKCAEDVVVEKLGGDPSKVKFSEAIRPRTGQQVPVCERCQGKYTKDQFAEGAIFAGPNVKMPK